uniref:Uncharacterized protein n=1 Tax=Timema douglasi TaxID=61478 RepID=A0A7R8Z507_TIMDO|nr:unnamed protein product [Timema douglasi]
MNFKLTNPVIDNAKLLGVCNASRRSGKRLRLETKFEFELRTVASSLKKVTLKSSVIVITMSMSSIIKISSSSPVDDSDCDLKFKVPSESESSDIEDSLSGSEDKNTSQLDDNLSIMIHTSQVSVVQSSSSDKRSGRIADSPVITRPNSNIPEADVREVMLRTRLRTGRGADLVRVSVLFIQATGVDVLVRACPIRRGEVSIRLCETWSPPAGLSPGADVLHGGDGTSVELPEQARIRQSRQGDAREDGESAQNQGAQIRR